MKILTLNVHSHFDKMTDEQFSKALQELSTQMISQSIDLIALQECSQSCEAELVEGSNLTSFSFIPEDKISIRKDNFAYLLHKKLEEKGVDYYWTWTGAKIGYDRFDEGLAVFSNKPILEAEAFYYSKQADYHNWKSRKTIGICIEKEGKPAWFYSVHMGWWKDSEEPFAGQMDYLQKKLYNKEKVFLLGDFNSQADISGEGYDYVKSLGWKDTYHLAENKDDGVTVPGTIDGWKSVENGMRIDYIFSKEIVRVLSSRVVFSGQVEQEISDHFGVVVEIE